MADNDGGARGDADWLSQTHGICHGVPGSLGKEITLSNYGRDSVGGRVAYN